MPTLNSAWYQQKRSDSAQPSTRTKAPSTMSWDEQEALTARLAKPTESARHRRAMYWKMDSFMEAGRHSWSKMELLKDCKKCLWTPSGSIKTSSCKIRPIKVISKVKGPAPGI